MSKQWEGASDMKNDGGPAFACISASAQYHQLGMSLRDWFAGQSIAAMAREAGSDEQTANWAYKVADAMLKAREEVGDE